MSSIGWKIKMRFILAIAVSISSAGFVIFAGSNYLEGEWIRQEVTINGCPAKNTKVFLEFKDDSFKKSYRGKEECAISGKQRVSDGEIGMLVEYSTCPGYPVEKNITASFTLSDDKNTLVVVSEEYGNEIQEVYQRRFTYSPD